MITLNLGSNLDETDIKEGDDVYFECDVTSNPDAYKVTWRRNVRERRKSCVRIFRPQFMVCPLQRICCSKKVG